MLAACTCMSEHTCAAGARCEGKSRASAAAAAHPSITPWLGPGPCPAWVADLEEEAWQVDEVVGAEHRKAALQGGDAKRGGGEGAAAAGACVQQGRDPTRVADACKRARVVHEWGWVGGGQESC